jgi:hypothetical protein
MLEDKGLNKKAIEENLKKVGGINARFNIIKDSLVKEVNIPIKNYVKKIEKDLYNKLSSRFISGDDIDKIMKNVDFQIAEITEKVRSSVKKISGAYVDVNVEADKVKSALTDYFSRDYTKDVVGVLMSTKDQYEAALNQIQLVVNTQAKKDFKILTESIKKYENKDLKDNFESFIKVFNNDYGAKYLDEMMKNPTLSKMIKQEEGELFFYAKNGKRYNLEDYINQRADWTTTDITRKTADQLAKESGAEVFKFERVRNFEVKEPRPLHKTYEGRLFSNNEEIVAKSGGEILSSKLIDDYEIGGEAPYGCGHAYIPMNYGEGE